MTQPNDADEPELRRMLERATELQLFPVAAERVRVLASRSDTSLADLEKAVSVDPALSAQVLKIANSPFFSMPRAVGDLRQALLLLGFQATRDLALALAVMTLAKGPKAGGSGLWEHSVRVGVGARLFGEEFGSTDSRDLFVAGLLHDLGKLIMLHLDPDRFARTQRPIDEESLPAERDAYGFEHARLGAACLRHWDLPESIWSAVLHHHDPDFVVEHLETTEGRSAAAVWLANQLARIEPAVNI